LLERYSGSAYTDQLDYFCSMSTGKLDLPKPGEKQLGGHAVMAVGYDDSAKRALIRNSWGRSWGTKGYFTMPYDYISDDNLADDFWTIRLYENV
jgi:C1A family cysteine protease